jgi:amidohydrolase
VPFAIPPAQYAVDTVAMRRHLHAHPELSFEETNTAAFVTQELQKLGLTPQPIANTGVVALIEGQPGGPTIALRADMDALPITEASDVPYRSTNPGVMHACGHDVHTASLLGAARILNELKGDFKGTIKLMFQPGEERLPGGASLMIKEGVLENPAVGKVLGQHVFPHLPAGKIGLRPGRYMASTDELYLTIKGKGGHGAMPEMNLDPVLVAAHLIVAAQQIVSRRANPKIPSVLSFGKVIANGATNVIPNEVYLEGTFRTLNEEWRAEAHQHLRQLCEGLAASMGAVCELEIRHGYPYLENEPALTARVRAAAEQYLGPENVVELDQWMAAEDFAYFSQAAPACEK